MSTKLIRELFEDRLKDWAAARIPTIRVNYEDTKFTPQTGETYLRAFTLPARTDSVDLEGKHRQYQGIWQINIVKPAAGGLGTAYGIVDELEALFNVNLRLTSGSFAVTVITPMGPGPLISDSNTSTVPVYCTYRADVAL